MHGPIKSMQGVVKRLDNDILELRPTSSVVLNLWAMGAFCGGPGTFLV